ncbi:cell division control protein 6 homolog [Rhipicephalus sanguineus]|uniref:cell division control protein 6 homolog n=1 Tax=Rhipicephalus sanguineus TaxID=34632 RepID=UPI0018959526|nr:cell division control protein 6 homolog [Rhipicephalus sanguineus]
MPSTQSVLQLPVRKSARCAAKVKQSSKSPSNCKKALFDENNTRHIHRVSKRLFSAEDASASSSDGDGSHHSPTSQSPKKAKEIPSHENMVSLCLSTPDTSLYQKAKQNLTSQSSVRVVGRQREMETMKEFLHSHLRAGTSGSLYVSGAPGTGKTACLSQILESSKNLFKFQYVFVNCMTLQSSSAIYQKIISGLDLSPACSSHLETIRRRLTTKGHPMIIVMDEIDQLDSKNQTVLYSLFELPQLKNSRATIFGIANALDLTDRVLPHLQAYGCRPTLLHFAPYSIDEIVAILMDRLNECHAVIQPQAIQFCARKIAACTGDVRKALDICRRAVEIVERSAKTQQVLVPRPEHGYNLGSPKKAPLKVVNMAHISSVLADVFGSSAMGSKDLNATLPLQQKLLLCTLVALLKVKKLRDVLLGKLQEAYMRICQRHQCSTDQSDFQSLSTLLESRGLITVKRHKELRLSKVSLRVDEKEVEYVLQDKALLAACLNDSAIL